MTDALTQTTSELSLEQCDEMFLKGVLLIKDAVFGYAKHQLTGTEIGKRVRALGAKLSDSQARRYIQQFKAQGLLDEKKPHRTTVARREERANAQNAQMHQPTTTTTTINDLPHHPASTPQQQCVQADDWGDATVVTAEVVTMLDGEQDYQRAIQLFAELDALAARNFANGWTELQWNTLGGECRTLAECCDARGKRQRSRPQRQMFAHAAN